MMVMIVVMMVVMMMIMFKTRFEPRISHLRLFAPKLVHKRTLGGSADGFPRGSVTLKIHSVDFRITWP